MQALCRQVLWGGQAALRWTDEPASWAHRANVKGRLESSALSPQCSLVLLPGASGQTQTQDNPKKVT